jgi:quercetin dioxygenase-like cupin family protein
MRMPKLTSISSRTKILLCCAVITCFASVTALATPGMGFLFNIILSRGTIPTDVHQDIFIETDTVNGSTPDNNQGDNWSVKLKTSGPSDLAVQDVAFSTGGFTGWHYHPGLLLATVTEGSVEWYDVNCGLHVYNAGDSFTENNESHDVRNVAPVRARLMITYILPKGAIRRLESDAPPCAAALGLQ